MYLAEFFFYIFRWLMSVSVYNWKQNLNLNLADLSLYHLILD